MFFVNVIKATHLKKKYDVSTVCFYYPERQEMLLKLKEYFKKNNISYFFYVFLHWKSFVKNFSSIRKRFFDINLKTLSKEKMFDILNCTKVILDIPTKKQDRLTMRTFETIEKEKKLVVTLQIEQEQIQAGRNVFQKDIADRKSHV